MLRREFGDILDLESALAVSVVAARRSRCREQRQSRLMKDCANPEFGNRNRPLDGRMLCDQVASVAALASLARGA